MLTPISPGLIWFVTAVLVLAAVIDGYQLRVPNWLTHSFIVGGLAFSACAGGAPALWQSTAGFALGLALLMPLYAIGGMGAGDVKLLAGLGAWVGPGLVFGAFQVFGIVGGLMAVVMVVRSGELTRHLRMFRTIGHEIVTVRDPVRLSEIAAERKPTMMLLPYGIPITVGAIAYFAWLGLFV